MNKILLGVIVVLVIVAGVWYAGKDEGVETTETEITAIDESNDVEENDVLEDELEEEDEATDETSADGDVKEFVVTGANFSFDPEEIRVNEGDTVRIVFKSEDMLHDWVVDEFEGAQTAQLRTGEEETIEFVADKAGEFEYYCSVGNHRAMGMVGTLIVE